MTCRRTLDLDLTAFLLEPRDAAWDEFRAHYPLCPACSAEVAAWTAVHASLGQQHPEPAALLRWSDDPASLDQATRAQIVRHLERCASCVDELRALGGFAASRVLAAEDSHGTARRSAPLHAVRRVLWHPALAYAALVAVLLLPTLRARFDDSAGRAAFAPAETSAPAPPPAAVVEPMPEQRLEALADAPRDAVREDRAAEAEQPFARAKRAADASREPPGASSNRVASLAETRAAAQPSTGGASHMRLEAPTDGTRTLVVPLPYGGTTGGPLEIRVRDQSGDRELRQTVRPSPGAREVTLELPSTLLDGTSWLVEVYSESQQLLAHGTVSAR